MGRVRRYKKVKACDPYSRSRNNKQDLLYDEPPDVFEEKARKARNKQKILNIDDEEDRDIIFQREAMKDIKESKSTPVKNYANKIEGKREDESMRAFHQRLRTETRLTLRDELKKMSASSQRKKLKLKERALKKKQKNRKRGDSYEEEATEFSSDSNGQIRSSDKGGAGSFKSYESIQFGERVEKPPDLKPFSKNLKLKKKGLNGMLQTMQIKGQVEVENNDDGKGENSIEGGYSSDISHDGTRRTKRKKSDFERMFETDDSLEVRLRTSSFKLNNRMKQTQITAGSNDREKNSYNELERARDEARYAYKKIRERRIKAKKSL